MEIKKLRIGVDARILSESITGIGRYSYEILSRLVDFGHHWFLYSHQPIIVGNWNKANVHLRTSNICGGRVFRMLWAQTMLPMLANRDALDIYWAPSPRIPFFLSPKCTKVVTVHDLVWKHAGSTMRPLSRFLDSLMVPQSVRSSNTVIAVSNSTKRDLCEEVPEIESKIKVILSGANHKFVNAVSDVACTFSNFILFVGTLEPRKNLSRFLQAFSLVPENIRKDVSILIVGGDGWGGVNVSKIATNLGIGERVRILGYISDAELQVLYSKALFLAMPSLYEGFGLPLVEAMKYGTPSLTSNISSMPEIAADAAVLVDPYNIYSISSGISKLLSDKSYLNFLKDRALLRHNNFSWDIAAQKTMSVFQKSIERSY